MAARWVELIARRSLTAGLDSSTFRCFGIALAHFITPTPGLEGVGPLNNHPGRHFHLDRGRDGVYPSCRQVERARHLFHAHPTREVVQHRGFPAF